MISKLFHRLGLSTTLLYRKDCLLRSKKKSFLSRLEEGQVSVRLANANDYDEILELSQNIKDTFDYFPFRFHKWLAEPDKIAVQGVQNSSQKHKIRDKELLDYDFLTYKVDPEQVNFEHKLQNCSKLRPCPKEDSLFPNNILVIDWQPFEAIPSNIGYIAQDRDRYFVDSSNGCQSQLHPSSFSLGRFVQVVCGMVWSSTIYAKDSELCQSHVIHQLMSANQTAKGNFLFSTEVLNDIPGVTRINDEEPFQKMFIFEAIDSTSSPYKFKKWLAEPNRITMVAEKGSKMVGFMRCSVVDGNESMFFDWPYPGRNSYFGAFKAQDEIARIRKRKRGRNMLNRSRNTTDNLCFRYRFRDVFSRFRCCVYNGTGPLLRKHNGNMELHPTKLSQRKSILDTSYKTAPNLCCKQRVHSSLFSNNILVFDRHILKLSHPVSITSYRIRIDIKSSGFHVSLTSMIKVKDSKLCLSVLM
ncbi:hypothetical protein pdam_00010005 [Pocillopora damicornis]|uniref:Histidine N-acetyltransferase C-terminal domain-containing protein n=1 Tax=Pocillopora damicornis TaxID=46731 RepID=A0A3M6UZD4_POCDA|nr:hypothetical protein pdam_00010005 [Pocillopora damicornis]